MRWRLLGVTGLLLVVGAAGGWAVSSTRSVDPQVIGSISPVPAQSPAVPTPTATTCFTDPSDAALGEGLASEPHRLSTGKRGYAVTLDVPYGWRIVRLGQTRWAMTDSAALNSYVMRVNIIADTTVSVPAALASRLVQLREAETEGNLPDFEVESSNGDSFTATYRLNGFCRVTDERFLSLGQSSAYVDLAVTGREEDRPGLTELLSRTAETMQVS